MNKPLHRLNQKEPHILILIIMSSFAAMGAVIFTPALPQISNYFKITQGHSQLAVTLFLVGYALGQLIYGPLSNRFGRKRAFYIGVIIATLGSIISIVSEPLDTFSFLILGRMLEALGSSAGLVISFTIINDHYYPEQARKIISYLMLAFAIVPGVSVFIGGILVTSFHWISCFYFLLIYGLLLLVPVKLLTETSQIKDKNALNLSHIRNNYKAAFKNKLLRTSALIYGLSIMCVYCYAASAPSIAIHYLGFSPQTYGFLGLIPFMGTGLGALISAKLSSRIGALSLIKMGIFIETLASLVLAGLFYTHIVSLFILLACGFVFMFGGCLIMSNAASLATSKIQDKANGSAAMNFINLSMPVGGTLALALIPGSEIIKLPTLFLIALSGMGMLWPILKKQSRI